MSEPTQDKTSGEWLYTHQDPNLLTKIRKSGWRPDLFTGTKYGCGVYLSRQPWCQEATEALVCEIAIPDDAVIDSFPPAKGWESEGSGNTYKHLSRYLQSQKVIAGNHPAPERGDSPRNRAIRDHFVEQEVKAVRIVEHDFDVLIVYDPTAISIIERRQLK